MECTCGVGEELFVYQLKFARLYSRCIKLKCAGNAKLYPTEGRLNTANATGTNYTFHLFNIAECEAMRAMGVSSEH